MSDSPAAILFDVNGIAMAVNDGYHLTSENNGFIALGSDGTNARFLKTNSSGILQTVQQANSATRTSVAASITSVLIIAANTNRKGLKLYNDSASGVLFIGYGSAVTDSDFTLAIPTGSLFELAVPMFTGAIHGLWSAADGAVRITEIF